MIDRYTRPEMGSVWSNHNKFQKMLDVEVAVAKAQASEGIIPKKAAESIAKKSKFSVDRILEIEKTTKHDVIAFVSNVAENVGPYGRYIHFGMTSSDVLDTGMSLLVQEAGKVLKESSKKLEKALLKQAKKHKATLCSGRTHGMHAEPTSFGLKMLGFFLELRRNQERINIALENLRIGKLSGAVGTYSTSPTKIEKKVCRELKLKPESIATQVIPRDRHAEVLTALAILGSGLERLSVELRHLQRTEVYEVIEGFSKGQKGSSAMPHKKNPISAENITGLSRLLRSYSLAAMEDVALWHERDISHSSVERVIFPDAFIVADYALERMSRVIEGLAVNKDRMWENMNISQGQLFSSHVLLALIESGDSREDAYKKVQSFSHSLKPGEHLEGLLLDSEEMLKKIGKKKIKNIFSGKYHKKAIESLFDRTLKMKAN